MSWEPHRLTGNYLRWRPVFDTTWNRFLNQTTNLYYCVVIQCFAKSMSKIVLYHLSTVKKKRRLPLQRWKITWRGRIHVIKKLKVRRGRTVPSPLTWHSTKKSDGIKEFATTDSMDACNVLLETQFVWTRQRVDTTRISSVGVPFPLGKLPERGQSLASNRH